MAEIRPFRGLRYRVPAEQMGGVIAPPYDVISAQQQQALYDLSPQNIIRIEYGREPGEARYAAAADALAAWQRQGVLAAEATPSLYLYQQEFVHGGKTYRRRGVLARVRLEPIEAAIIRPHEFTLAPAKADRLALLRATRTNVSPLLSLIYDPAGTFNAALDAEETAQVTDATDFTGQRHRLSVIDDPRAVAGIVQAVAGEPLYIADGHHRYETALTYQAEQRAAASKWTGEEPANFVLMSITATEDPGLLILPIHRVVRPRTFPTDTLTRLAEAFEVVDAGALTDPAARAALVARLDEAGKATNAFAAAGLAPGRLHLLTLRNRAAVEARMPGDHPPAWKALDVNVLQFGILEPLFGIDQQTLVGGEHVSFTEDAAEAFEAVASGKVPLALLVNATRAEQIIAVADGGDRMPQKSTYFYPKLGTGLVLNSLDL